MYIEPAANNLRIFILTPIDIEQYRRSHTPTTEIMCSSNQDEEPWTLDEIPKQAQWLWRDLKTSADRHKKLILRLFKVDEQMEEQPYWSCVLTYEDKFVEFCLIANSGRDHTIDMHGQSCSVDTVK